MGALITSDPAVLAVVAPDGTPATADTIAGAQLTSVVAGNAVAFRGAVGAIVTRVMVGEGAYFDGDTTSTEFVFYQWAGAPDASASTEWQEQPMPGGISRTTQWDDLACGHGAVSNYGRWNDQSANLRWDQVDPAATWDSYLGG